MLQLDLSELEHALLGKRCFVPLLYSFCELRSDSYDDWVLEVGKSELTPQV